MSDAHSVTQLLEQWNHGDREALDKLMPLIYEELRKMAKRYMSQQNPGHTLQTTALIHEAYLRMVKQKEKHFENRAHFFGVAAQAMRHILVDYARATTYSQARRRSPSNLSGRGCAGDPGTGRRTGCL